jgi:hypothetical protein
MALRDNIVCLAEPEIARTGFTHAMRVLFSDLVSLGGANLAYTEQLIPPTGSGLGGYQVNKAAFLTKTAFTGGAVSALTLNFGDNGSATRYISAGSIFTATHLTAATLYGYPIGATNYLQVVFTAVTANLNVLTAGEGWLLFSLTDMGQTAK